MNKLVNLRCLMLVNQTKLIHTSSSLGLDQKWRTKMRLAANPNAEGPLTSLPDYTYMDGRPTPLGQRQKRKLMFQREIVGKIVESCKELNNAVERYNKLQTEEKQREQSIYDNKLKPKGHLLFKQKN